MSNQLACFTFFRYKGKNRKWGFGQMFKARPDLDKIDTLKFYKLVGLGGGTGYSLKTNFDSFGIFTVWNDPSDADRFFKSSLFGEFLRRSYEHFTIIMRPITSRGSWSGFKGWKLSKIDPNNDLICVLTRATIKVKFIYPFFSMISKVLKDHNSFPGLLFSRGFSEIPLREQATFSVWENVEHMKKFAYNSFHAMAIKITRKKKGFREDMYTRFQPVATMGTWHGDNPLINKVKQLSDYQLAPVALR